LQQSRLRGDPFDEQVRDAIYTSLPGDHAVRVKNHT